MYISARVDYAMRALLELAAAQRDNPRALLKGDAIAETHDIPTKFLVGVLTTLRTAGILQSMRGRDGGFRLAKPAADIRVADVMRALEGPLAEVRGERPEETEYLGAAEHLRDLWIATRVALRSVLETTSLADIESGNLPSEVAALLSAPGAWARR
ncbi:MAG: Rrf2 family transcriptional regulator [Microbacteriaceae bacterium]|jgi:Rrf2 family protein|nr:Rrf2 family transcriptional regulator [Microbacteriaceae bacterium]